MYFKKYWSKYQKYFIKNTVKTAYFLSTKGEYLSRVCFLSVIPALTVHDSCQKKTAMILWLSYAYWCKYPYRADTLGPLLVADPKFSRERQPPRGSKHSI